MKLEVNDSLRCFLPDLEKTEHELLEASIAEHGRAIDPIVYCFIEGSFTILDGHHRYEICERLGLPYSSLYVQINSIADAKRWMFDKQIGQRNLSVGQIIALAVLHEMHIPESARSRSKACELAVELSQTDGGREVLARCARGETTIQRAAKSYLYTAAHPIRGKRSHKDRVLDSIRQLQRPDLEEVANEIISLLEEGEE